MSERIILTNKQARKFMLLKHGLIGSYRFSGKQGVLDFVRQAGCIQFDPIDICGKNAELVLHSRVKGFTKETLYSLLYKERTLLDYFDKNLAIMLTTDWPYFRRFREVYKTSVRSLDKVNAVSRQIRNIILEKGPVCSSDIGMNEKVDWYWNSTNLSRAALEAMYFRGELVIHHKKGTVKYYDLAENAICSEVLNASDPIEDDFEHKKWRVLRRIGGVGLLWNRASDAWLNIPELNTNERNRIFKELVDEGKITEVVVENIKDSLYCLSGDLALIDTVLKDTELKGRCEVLAPLDNMLWDRRLIRELFGFEYKWEVYIPKNQRKFGYYVLPLLYGDRFIGRVEPVCDRKEKTMALENIWYEKDIKQTGKLQKAVEDCMHRLAEFNGCSFVGCGRKLDAL